MSVEENKAAASRFYEEVFNQGNRAVIDEVLATDIVDHTPMPDQAPGIEGMKQVIGMFLGAFPNMSMTLDHMVAEGDIVVIRGTMTGTHSADMMGIPPTGRQMTMSGMDLLRFSDGKVVDMWHYEDILGMFKQLGVAPPMG